MKGLYLRTEEQRDFYSIQDVNRGCAVHFHNKVEMLYILSGHHIATINGRDYHAEADEIFFVNVYDIHKYESPDNGEHILVDFSIDKFLDLKKIFHNKALPNILRDKSANREILSLIKSTLGVQLTHLGAASVVYALMDKFISVYGLKEDKQIKDENLIRQMLLYLNENYAQPFNRDEFASKFGYNTSYISHIFKKQVGMGMVEYVRTIRYNKVREILESSDGRSKNVIDVVLGCGFESISAYYRFARKVKKSSESEVES